jgi:hypothetical protein
MQEEQIAKAKEQKARYTDCYCIDIVIFNDGAFVVNMLDELALDAIKDIKKIKVISTGVKKL